MFLFLVLLGLFFDGTISLRQILHHNNIEHIRTTVSKTQLKIETPTPNKKERKEKQTKVTNQPTNKQANEKTKGSVFRECSLCLYILRYNMKYIIYQEDSGNENVAVDAPDGKLLCGCCCCCCDFEEVWMAVDSVVVVDVDNVGGVCTGRVVEMMIVLNS